MDKQSDKEKQSQSSSSQSRGSGGAYYELEPKKQKSKLGALILGGVLLAALAGGAYIAKNKSMTAAPDAQEKVMANANQELVKAILALHDDHEDPVAKKAAATAIKNHLEQKKQLESKPVVATTTIEGSKEVQPIPSAQLGFFKGILTRCFITGNDVHWVDETGHIMEHVGKNIPLQANAEVAREYINGTQPVLVVVVYEKGYEIFDQNGKLVKTSQP